MVTVNGHGDGMFIIAESNEEKEQPIQPTFTLTGKKQPHWQKHFIPQHGFFGDKTSIDLKYFQHTC
jgi:hypothetical protein